MKRREKKKIDMLNGSLMDKLLLFALPLAATSILQQLFNIADVAVVGQFVGKEAMAAVGSNSAIINLAVNLFIGIALGCNVAIAQAIGRKDMKQVNRIVHTSLLFAAIAGVLVAGLGEWIAPAVLRATNVPEEILPMATSYLRIYMAGMPVILLYNFEAAVFRAKGDTQTPLIVLVISGIVNVLLNLFLVLVVHMNVSGVALATVVSNLVSAVILFVLLSKAQDATRVRLSELRLDRFVLGNVLKVGLPAGIQSALFSLANIIIQSAINSLGPTVMAGSSAAFNLEVMSFFVMNAFGQACTTFVGQNYGAGNYDRCREIFYKTLILNYIFTAAVCGLILVFARQLLGLFNPDPEVIEVGYERLVLLFIAYILHTLQETGSGYLRGFGKSMLPALNSLICICGIRIVYIFTVFRMFPTFRTIMLVYPISLWAAGISILIIILIVRPSRRYARPEPAERALESTGG